MSVQPTHNLYRCRTDKPLHWKITRERTRLSKTNFHQYFFLNSFKYLQIHEEISLKGKGKALPDYTPCVMAYQRVWDPWQITVKLFLDIFSLNINEIKHASWDSKLQLKRAQQLDFFIWLVRTLIALYPHPLKQRLKNNRNPTEAKKVPKTKEDQIK